MAGSTQRRRLKVFRHSIGFHDAYIAAPSQKAALAAWGAESDLFARGLAERVEDPDLMREPLANPGKVIRRLRGTSAEQIAALPADAPRPRAPRTAKAAPTTPPPEPRPDHSAVDRAERDMAELETRHRKAQAALAQRQADLDHERRALRASQQDESAKARTALDKARATYERAMQNWRR